MEHKFKIGDCVRILPAHKTSVCWGRDYDIGSHATIVEIQDYEHFTLDIDGIGVRGCYSLPQLELIVSEPVNMPSTYIIKIEEVQPSDGATYEKTKTIYEQRIVGLDVEAVIKAANKMKSI